jgi:peptidyl-prolyl cis-trans isomerase D
MTTGGVKRDQSIGLAANASVIEAAFSPDVLFDGNNSNLIEITPNHHVVLRVSNHQPQELKALETVSDEVTEAIRLEKATEIAQQQAKEMVEMLESGSITRFVADQYGLEWTVVGEATRNEMQMDREINVQAFALPRPQEGNKSIGYAILANGDAAVISVTNVVNKPDDEVSGEELSSFARALASQQGQSDYLEFRGNLYAEGTIE